jgi:hypothetical protein
MAGISHWLIQVPETVFAVQAARLFHVVQCLQVTTLKTSLSGFFETQFQ